ncbi:MAG: hypothetical protein C4294_20140, partial [Nitrospiraceae bacterium]
EIDHRADGTAALHGAGQVRASAIDGAVVFTRGEPDVGPGKSSRPAKTAQLAEKKLARLAKTRVAPPPWKLASTRCPPVSGFRFRAAG